MALRYFTGFDFMGSGSEVVQAGFANASGGISSGGRNGFNCLLCSSSTGIVFSGYQTTWIAGMAFKPSAAISQQLFNFRSVAIYPGGTLLGGVGFDGTYLYAQDATGATTTGTTYVPWGSWHYVEMKVVHSATVGSITVVLNSVTEITWTGRNTGTSANVWDLEAHGQAFQTGQCVVDDIYICDGTGSAPYNDFLGDVSCQTILPNGAGASTQFTHAGTSDSGVNWSNVDETPNDGDASYNYSSTVGNKDLYDYSSVAATSGSVYAVQPWLLVRKDDAGARSVCSVARLSGGTEEDSANFSLAETYGYLHDIRTTKPGGGTWSISDVNAAQFGIKVTV